MQRIDKREDGSVILILDKASLAVCALLLAMAMSGCSSTPVTSPTPPTAASKSPQVYLAPYVAGTTAGGGPINSPQTYTVDDMGGAFSRATYALSGIQEGAQIVNAGSIATTSRGLLALSVTTVYTYNSSLNTWVATVYPTSTQPIQVGYAVEVSGQSGGLIQLPGQPMAPLVPTAACPSIATAQTYQFLSIPAAFTKATPTPAGAWNPQTDTAYGTIDIKTNGSSVSFANGKQFTLSSVGGSGVVSDPMTGACGMTAFGNAVSVPGQVIINNPGNQGSNPPQAILGIGISGLLVEDNGDQVTYQNVLGAGTGAVGLPRPSAAVNTSAVVGAQYQGFIYGAGVYTNSSSPTGWSSHLASFGFSNVPSSCASVAGATSTLIYGGTFTKDDPSTGTNGFGNCNVAIDLGVQDTVNQGFYPNAKVWMDATYPGNTTANSFSAIAIAGQLQGKYGIFLLGVDSKQPWSIYLLQSN